MQTEVRKQRGTFPTPICNSNVGLCLYQGCPDPEPCSLRSLPWELWRNTEPQAHTPCWCASSFLRRSAHIVMKVLIPRRCLRPPTPAWEGSRKQAGCFLPGPPSLRAQPEQGPAPRWASVDCHGPSWSARAGLSPRRPGPSQQGREGSPFRTHSRASCQRWAPWGCSPRSSPSSCPELGLELLSLTGSPAPSLSWALQSRSHS